MVKNHPEGAPICVQRQVSCQIRRLQETIRTQNIINHYVSLSIFEEVGRTAVHAKCQSDRTQGIRANRKCCDALSHSGQTVFSPYRRLSWLWPSPRRDASPGHQDSLLVRLSERSVRGRAHRQIKSSRTPFIIGYMNGPRAN